MVRYQYNHHEDARIPNDGNYNSEAEWETIMVPLLQTGLPCAGISSKFPRDVLYGPSTFQGFGVIHPWYHQQLTYLIVLMEHTQQNTMTGQLLTTSFEQLRLKIGASGFLTDNPYKTLQATTTKHGSPTHGN